MDSEPDWDAIVRREQAAPYRLLEVGEVAELPDPTWLVEGMIPEGFAALYAPPSAFKSFVALDLAMHVAAGLQWLGRAVNAGHVVYVAAEGAGGLKGRMLAWQEAHDWPCLERMHFLPETVNILDRTSANRLFATVYDLPEPALVIVDTMARSMLDGDENHAHDVGRLVEALDDLPVRTRLVVHHTGKNGESERGSSALRGAADVMLRLDRESGSYRVTLGCDKPPKDAEAWHEIPLAMERVADSLVPRPVPMLAAAMSAEEERVAGILAYITENGPASQRDVERAVRGRRETLRSTLDQLVVQGRLTVADGLHGSKLYTLQTTAPPQPGRAGASWGAVPGRVPRPEPPHTPRRGVGFGGAVEAPSSSPAPLAAPPADMPEQAHAPDVSSNGHSEASS